MGIQWIRHSIRSFRRDWRYALAAIATLALASGASTAVFSVVHGVLLRPLPYERPGELIRIRIDAEGRQNSISISGPEVIDLRERTTLFQGFGGFWTTPVTLGEGEEAAQVTAATVTANLFALLGIPPHRGRTFLPGEDAPNAAFTALLSYELWTSRFRSDPAIVGQVIRVNGERFHVLGVMPPAVRLIGRGAPEAVIDLFIPQTLWSNRDLRFLRVIGRLEPGVSLAQAQSELDAVAAQLRKEFDYDAKGGLAFRASYLLADHVEPVRPALWAFLGAVLLVLLIACSTVASLLLARLKTREQEVAIKAALGGGRFAVLGPMIAEAVVLASVAAAAGVGLAHLALRALRVLHPPTLPRADEIAINLPVLIAASAAALVTGLICSVGPAWQAARLDVSQALRSAGRSSTGRLSARLRGTLLVAQVAFTVVLLAAAGLLIRSALNLRNMDLSFAPAPVLAVDVPISLQLFGTGAKRYERYETLLRQLAELPGVQSAGATSLAPFAGGFLSSSYSYGPNARAMWGSLAAEHRIVLPGYFEAVKARLVAGRFFTWSDHAPGIRRVLVDDSLARRAWPGLDPIGQPLLVSAGDLGERDEPIVAEVIGVVRQMRQTTLRGEEPPQVYLPYGTRDNILHSPLQLTFVMRAAGDPHDLEERVTSVVAASGVGRPAHTVRTLGEAITAATSDVRFAVRLMLLFAALALVLTAFGLYAVVAYVVEQRRYEFGVRVALGARHSQVIAQVLRQGLALTLAGLALGLAGSAVATRVLHSLLFGVRPIDTPTFASVIGLVALVAAAACLVPARRIVSIDPARSMRAE